MYWELTMSMSVLHSKDPKTYLTSKLFEVKYRAQYRYVLFQDISTEIFSFGTLPHTSFLNNVFSLRQKTPGESRGRPHLHCNAQGFGIKSCVLFLLCFVFVVGSQYKARASLELLAHFVHVQNQEWLQLLVIWRTKHKLYFGVQNFTKAHFYLTVIYCA